MSAEEITALCAAIAGGIGVIASAITVAIKKIRASIKCKKCAEREKEEPHEEVGDDE